MDEIDMQEQLQAAREKRYKSRKRKRNVIKKELLSQLDELSISGKHFEDLVEDYMSLWDTKNELIFDIEDKGVSVFYQNGANQWGYKKNDSVAELNRVNGQMLKIIASLHLQPEAKEDDGDFML